LTGFEGRERRALRLIGGAFLLLAAYILIQAVYVLIAGAHPHQSRAGIVWLALTFVAMVLLARAKGETGRKLGNAVLLTESRVTMVDAYLAGAVLAGLALNAAFGWWWTDPLAGFVIVFYGVKEGLAAWRESASELERSYR
jgi:divalent metal cation (Fe/Co/Zn/Cd) transporter